MKKMNLLFTASRLFVGIFVLIPGVLFFACQSKKNPSFSAEKILGSALPAETDDYYQEIINYSGID